MENRTRQDVSITIKAGCNVFLEITEKSFWTGTFP